MHSTWNFWLSLKNVKFWYVLFSWRQVLLLMNLRLNIFLFCCLVTCLWLQSWADSSADEGSLKMIIKFIFATPYLVYGSLSQLKWTTLGLTQAKNNTMRSTPKNRKMIWNRILWCVDVADKDGKEMFCKQTFANSLPSSTKKRDY